MMMIQAFCLALAMYHEARGEPIEGQIAVAETIYNRMEKGAYPDSWCGVALQANQYAVTTIAADRLIPREDFAFEVAMLMAVLIVQDPEGTLGETGATHFFSGKDNPAWAKEFTKVATIGGHQFYAEN